MRIAGYRIHLDALLARIVYRWRGRAAVAATMLVLGVGLATGAVPPVWRGQAQLTVRAAPSARISVDGRAWPRALYAGAHTVAAALPDGRAAWADVALAAGEPITLTLPPGLSPPRAALLAPAAPGLRIERVWWADGGWRVRSAPAPDVAPTEEAGVEPTPYAGQTVTLGARSMRLTTIDAYAGLADTAHAGGALVEAVYAPGTEERAGAGVVTVRGWGRATVANTVASPLTLLSLSPAGDALLLAERAAAGAQVSLLARGGERVSLVAVPGRIARLDWKPDGAAVVISSRQGDRLALTLVRLRPSVLTAALADLDAASRAGDLAPLAWGDGAVLWAAPDADGAPSVWRAPLASPAAERVALLDARALQALPGGDVRVLAVQGGQLIVGRLRGAQFIGEAAVRDMTPADDLVGMWRGHELIVQSGERAWLLILAADE